MDDITKWIQIQLKQHNFLETDSILEKIQQIYYAILAHHGLIIVGEPMSGKTTAWKVIFLPKMEKLNTKKTHKIQTTKLLKNKIIPFTTLCNKKLFLIKYKIVQT